MESALPLSMQHVSVGVVGLQVEQGERGLRGHGICMNTCVFNWRPENTEQ